MPRMRKGWDDYIPAKGEARVLAELKGSYGGKNMYRRRGGRRQFRGSYRNQRFWVPFTGAVAGDRSLTTFDALTKPELVARITPQGATPDELSILNTQNYQLNSAQRLLMFQGSIPVWAELQAKNGEEWVDSASRNWLPIWNLFFWWQKVRGSLSTLDAADTGLGDENIHAQVSARYVWSNAPGAQGNLERMMMRKDVIQWGWRTIRPINPKNLLMTGTPNQFEGFPFDPKVYGRYTFLPLPRIPKRGYVFSQGDELRLFASVVPYQFNEVGITNYVSMPLTTDDAVSGAIIYAKPLFRGLFTK